MSTPSSAAAPGTPPVTAFARGGLTPQSAADSIYKGRDKSLPTKAVRAHRIPKRAFLIRMNHGNLITEIVGTYQKHGWQLQRVLLRPETRATIDAGLLAGSLWKDVQVEKATLDALWFSRASHENRDAWELRLLAETPFALFETFEEDETEEQREEMRREMEARLKAVTSDK